MSNLHSKNIWRPWDPKKVYLKNKKLYFLNLRHLKKEDFFLKSQYKKIDIQEKSNNDIHTNTSNKKECSKDFKKETLINKEKDVLFTNKFNALLTNFENSLFSFEKKLFPQVLKLVLMISSYVIGGEKYRLDENFLLNQIKKILDQNNILVQKFKLFVHPDNKKLIEKTFKSFLNTYQWELIFDNHIDINGCKIISENKEIDSTVTSRWKEIYRLISSEEYRCA